MSRGNASRVVGEVISGSMLCHGGWSGWVAFFFSFLEGRVTLLARHGQLGFAERCVVETPRSGSSLCVCGRLQLVFRTSPLRCVVGRWVVSQPWGASPTRKRPGRAKQEQGQGLATVSGQNKISKFAVLVVSTPCRARFRQPAAFSSRLLSPLSLRAWPPP